jgi:hypothetical protein
MRNSFSCRRDDASSVSNFPHTIRIASATLIAALALGVCSAAHAGPPAYLILRRPESPGRHYHPGYSDAAMYDARTSGYAYGFFGVAPRSHASRHFGYYRNYTQWSFW